MEIENKIRNFNSLLPPSVGILKSLGWNFYSSYFFNSEFLQPHSNSIKRINSLPQKLSTCRKIKRFQEFRNFNSLEFGELAIHPADIAGLQNNAISMLSFELLPIFFRTAPVDQIELPTKGGRIGVGLLIER